MSTKTEQYKYYLLEHTNRIKSGYRWMQQNMPNVFKDDEEIDYSNVIYDNIVGHDASKLSEEEWKPYEDYFYGEKTKEVEENFDYAWLHHIHNNPHHWQYWILIEDDGGAHQPKALDIPYPYIVEMILDWWAFSWKTGNLYEIIDWYKTHKDKMLMSESSRETVESIINAIVDKLNED